MNLLLTCAAIFAVATLAFPAGLALGSALCNRRWAEKCARCQRIVRSSLRDGRSM